MAVTINDVARLAGVSPSTVSKVLNNWSTISPATAERVHEAIRKLEYTPNARAVSFARQSTKNIAFLTAITRNEAYKNPHMFDIMCGVHNELAKENYSLMLIDSSRESYPGETAEKVISQKSADGIVVHGSAVNESVGNLLVKKQFPHIIIGHPNFSSQLCWIDTNHALAGEFAAEHMISCNYTNVAFVGGKKSDLISVQRERGFLGLMGKYGYGVPQSHVIHTDSSVGEAAAAALTLLSEKSPPRAIVCENSQIALGVSKGIEKTGKSVPNDIAFLTFDTYPYSGVIEPKPTIIDINMYDMGVQAGQVMLHKLENPSLQVQSYTTLPVLLQGESTKIKEV